MDKIWDRKSSKSKVIGRCGWRGWKNRMTTQNRQKSNAKKNYQKKSFKEKEQYKHKYRETDGWTGWFLYTQQTNFDYRVIKMRKERNHVPSAAFYLLGPSFLVSILGPLFRVHLTLSHKPNVDDSIKTKINTEIKKICWMASHMCFTMLKDG